MSTAIGVHVLPECATKRSVYWRTGGDHKITLLDGLYSIMSQAEKGREGSKVSREPLKLCNRDDS